MAFQLIELDADIDEPVTLAEQKAWSKIDAEYTYNDDQIEMMITTARVLIEQQLNIGLVKRRVQLEWDGRLIDMPLSPTGEIESVKDQDGTEVATDDYVVSSFTAKKIGIKAYMNCDLNFWYSRMGCVEITGTPPFIDITKAYFCIYETGYETMPKPLKHAIMTQADYILKNYGDPESETLSLDAMRLCRGYGRNLPL